MIMAGGAGTRLWPMSRRERPKQLLPFIGGRSLLQLATARLDGVVPVERRIVCAAETHRAAIRTALPNLSDDQIIGEPAVRDTVNAIGLTAALLVKRDPKAVFAVLTADHLIEPQSEFARAINLGFQLVESDSKRLVTFAIKPTFPATQYGYVERGEPLAGFSGAYRAKQFVEKPDAKTAQRYLDAGTFGWNSGMFIFSAATFLEALRWYKPSNHAGLMKVAERWSDRNRKAVLDDVYPTLEKISVDFAVMEPAAKDSRLTICIVPMNLSWMDVGSWPSYAETLKADADQNRANCHTLHSGSRGVLAVSDDPNHTIATVGCENLIIVRTADATLVCRADQAEKVKDLAGNVDEKLR